MITDSRDRMAFMREVTIKRREEAKALRPQEWEGKQVKALF